MGAIAFTASIFLFSFQGAGQRGSQSGPDALLARSTSSIHGRVVFRETGQPVEGARILPMSFTYQGRAAESEKTDREGNYSVKALRGTWIIRVILPPSLVNDYTSKEIRGIVLSKDESKKVDLEVFKGKRVFGRVTLPGGKAGAGISVTAAHTVVIRKDSYFYENYQTTTNQNGEYILNVPPDMYDLTYQFADRTMKYKVVNARSTCRLLCMPT